MSFCARCFGARNGTNDEGGDDKKAITDKVMRRILDRGYKIFCRMHTDGNISVRKVKEVLWARFPACGIAANALSITRTHYVLQFAIVLPELTNPTDLTSFVESTFREHLLPEQEWSEDAMQSTVACVINGRDMWEYYLYQLFMSHGIERTIIAEVTYGPKQSERLLETVDPPSSAAMVMISRSTEALTVMQPSTIIENSTVIPRDLLFTEKTKMMAKLSKQQSDDSTDMIERGIEHRTPTPIVSPLSLKSQAALGTTVKLPPGYERGESSRSS